MHNLAVDMDYFGGFDAEMRKHSRELNGASAIVKEWADEIGKEGGNES